jgi:hypothetical protein
LVAGGAEELVADDALGINQIERGPAVDVELAGDWAGVLALPPPHQERAVTFSAFIRSTPTGILIAMHEYQLERLNARSFEQLVQAVGIEIIGKQLMVFGDGPDGGRATFHGPVAHYSVAANGLSLLTVSVS